MRFDGNPPVQEIKGEYPSLDDVVAVANCWYYLSLMESFVEMTQSFTKEEDLLKMYLVRAEYRYCKWISSKVKHRQAEVNIPPLGKRQVFYTTCCTFQISFL